jgi:hypothetical protein
MNKNKKCKAIKHEQKEQKLALEAQYAIETERAHTRLLFWFRKQKIKKALA